MSDGGKGSAPRPFSDREQFERNFDRIFSKPVCFRSNPNAVEQAENCCHDCKHYNQCLEKQ